MDGADEEHEITEETPMNPDADSEKNDNKDSSEAPPKSVLARGRWQRATQELIKGIHGDEDEKGESQRGWNGFHQKGRMSNLVLQLQKLASGTSTSNLFSDLPEQEKRENRWRRIAVKLNQLDGEGGDDDNGHHGDGDEDDEKIELKRPEDQEGGAAWLMVFLVFMINAIMDGYQYSCGVIFVAIVKEFQATNADAAWISSIFQMCFCLVCPIGSLLLNMYGARLVCVLGTVLLSVGIASSCYVPNLWYLYITMGAISGIGTGLLAFVTSTILCFWFEKKISLANGIARVGTGVGLFAFPPLISYLIEDMGWRSACLILAGIVLQCLVFSALMRPNRKIRITIKSRNPKKLPLKFFITKTVELSNELSTAQTGLSIKAQEQRPSFRDTFRSVIHSTFDFKLFKQYEYAIFVIGNMIGFTTLKTPFLYTPVRALSLGISQSNVGWLVSSIGIANMVGRLGCGFIADLKIFRQRRLLLYSLCWMICGLATALSMLSGFIPQLVYASTFGIFFGAVIMLQPVVVKDLVGLERLSAAYGILRLGTALPSLIGAPLLGLLYDATLNYEVLFAAAGALLCLCALTLLLIIIIQKILTLRSSKETKLDIKEITSI